VDLNFGFWRSFVSERVAKALFIKVLRFRKNIFKKVAKIPPGEIQVRGDMIKCPDDIDTVGCSIAECGVRMNPKVPSAFARLRCDESAQCSKGRPSLCECMRVNTSSYDQTRGFLLFVSPARSGRVRPNQSKSRQSNHWVRLIAVVGPTANQGQLKAIKVDQGKSNLPDEPPPISWTVRSNRWKVNA
jgi:hypothetical protein